VKFLLESMECIWYESFQLQVLVCDDIVVLIELHVKGPHFVNK